MRRDEKQIVCLIERAMKDTFWSQPNNMRFHIVENDQISYMNKEKTLKVFEIGNRVQCSAAATN